MQSLKAKKRVVVALSMLTALTSFSVGFASWIISGSDVTAINGEMVAEEMGEPVVEWLPVVSITKLNSFKFNTGYGFLVDNVFVNETTISGECSVSTENAQKCISSYKFNKTFKLTVTLSTSLSSGLSSSGFSSNQISLTSSNFTVANQDPTDAESISSTFTISCTSISSDFGFTFALKLTYNQTLSTFPNLANALNVSFSAGED